MDPCGCGVLLGEPTMFMRLWCIVSNLTKMLWPFETPMKRLKTMEF